MIDSIVKALEGLLALNKAVESLLVDVIASYSPWLAPVIPAYMTWHSMSSILGFPVWVAWVGAAVIETIGLSAIQTAIFFWNFNQTKGVSTPAAPFWLAVITAMFYLTVVISANVLIEVYPQSEILVKALLSSLSVCGGVIIAMRAGQARRERKVEIEKQERRELRKVQGVQLAPQFAPLQVQTKYNWHNLPQDVKEAIRDMSAPEIVQSFGVSERTAQYWRSRNHNGNGSHQEINK